MMQAEIGTSTSDPRSKSTFESHVVPVKMGSSSTNSEQRLIRCRTGVESASVPIRGGDTLHTGHPQLEESEPSEINAISNQKLNSSIQKVKLEGVERTDTNDFSTATESHESEARQHAIALKAPATGTSRKPFESFSIPLRMGARSMHSSLQLHHPGSKALQINSLQVASLPQPPEEGPEEGQRSTIPIIKPPFLSLQLAGIAPATDWRAQSGLYEKNTKLTKECKRRHSSFLKMKSPKSPAAKRPNTPPVFYFGGSTPIQPPPTGHTSDEQVDNAEATRQKPSVLQSQTVCKLNLPRARAILQPALVSDKNLVSREAVAEDDSENSLFSFLEPKDYPVTSSKGMNTSPQASAVSKEPPAYNSECHSTEEKNVQAAFSGILKRAENSGGAENEEALSNVNIKGENTARLFKMFSEQYYNLPDGDKAVFSLPSTADRMKGNSGAKDSHGRTDSSDDKDSEAFQSLPPTTNVVHPAMRFKTPGCPQQDILPAQPIFSIGPLYPKRENPRDAVTSEVDVPFKDTDTDELILLLQEAIAGGNKSFAASLAKALAGRRERVQIIRQPRGPVQEPMQNFRDEPLTLYNTAVTAAASSYNDDDDDVDDGNDQYRNADFCVTGIPPGARPKVWPSLTKNDSVSGDDVDAAPERDIIAYETDNNFQKHDEFIAQQLAASIHEQASVSASGPFLQQLKPISLKND